jgi:nicotinamidase-related amidase
MSATALLVIDIQCGAFDGVRCPPIDRGIELVTHAAALVTAARAGNLPIVFVQHCAGANKALEEGTPHWEFHEALKPKPKDLVVKKYASSAFENTQLQPMLRATGVTNLVVCGLQSELCVFNTSLSALNLSYVVRIAQDGHSTWPTQDRSSAVISAEINAKLLQAGAVLEPTASLVKRLGRTA